MLLREAVGQKSTGGCKFVIDIEADGIDNPQNIWVVVLKDLESNEIKIIYDKESLTYALRNCYLLVGHNILSYDLPVLASVWGFHYVHSVFDTLIVSRLWNFSIDDGHSLEAWGKRMRHPKLEFSDFSKLTDSMVQYCINDVHLTHKLYSLMQARTNPAIWDSIELEHDMARLCRSIKITGFPFDIAKASKLHSEVLGIRDKLLGLIQKEFPPRVVNLGTVTPRLTKEGKISRANLRWCDTKDLDKFSSGASFSRFEYEDFNPNSPKQLVEVLNKLGWRPTEKTKGHKDAERAKDKAALAKYREYGWKVSEKNLATLPDDAPEAAKILVRYLLIENRVRTLQDWISRYDPSTGCIHHTVNPLGTWTHRMSHTEPNLGNVAAKKTIKYTEQSLRDEAIHYGGEFRSLFTVSKPEYWLVGTDADGIQMRVFAHYINDDKFTNALVGGNKEQGTDVHSLNQKVLGVDGITRDDAKTFIYAFILGAGDDLIASILRVSKSKSKEARERFIRSYPGLQFIRDNIIPRDADKGFFVGFDGRKVLCDSAHKMLAGYLQNGEAVIMKRACKIWTKKLTDMQVPFVLRNFVHDEWQTEVLDSSRELATLVGQIQAEAITQAGIDLNLNCPMAGTFRIGKNWLETH